MTTQNELKKLTSADLVETFFHYTRKRVFVPVHWCDTERDARRVAAGHICSGRLACACPEPSDQQSLNAVQRELDARGIQLFM